MSLQTSGIKQLFNHIQFATCLERHGINLCSAVNNHQVSRCKTFFTNHLSNISYSICMYVYVNHGFLHIFLRMFKTLWTSTWHPHLLHPALQNSRSRRHDADTKRRGGMALLEQQAGFADWPNRFDVDFVIRNHVGLGIKHGGRTNSWSCRVFMRVVHENDHGYVYIYITPIGI